MSILFRNVKLTDCHRELNADLLVEDGEIAAIGDRLPHTGAERIVSGRGKTLMPAFVDLHAHFRDPGLTHKEDIESGSRAAVRGGYTTVSLMANTNPVCSSMNLIRYVREKAAKVGLCELHQVASVTRDFDGVTLSHIDELDSSVKWLSDDGFGIRDTAVMLQAMRIARERGMGLMLHEEDPALTREDSYLAEELMTFRDAKLAVLTGCRTHFCHVSTMDSLNYIMAAKLQCNNITCEVTPHHLMLTEEAHYNVAPPLRRELHRKYLIAAVQKGAVDAIATDHAPHTAQDKAAGANGITGLDLAFSTAYTVLVRDGHIPLGELSRLMSYSPAQILGVRKGLLEVGYPADLVLIDEGARFEVSGEALASRGKNTPMLGRTLHGNILLTMKEGKIVYEKAD